MKFAGPSNPFDPSSAQADLGKPFKMDGGSGPFNPQGPGGGNQGGFPRPKLEPVKPMGGGGLVGQGGGFMNERRRPGQGAAPPPGVFGQGAPGQPGGQPLPFPSPAGGYMPPGGPFAQRSWMPNLFQQRMANIAALYGPGGSGWQQNFGIKPPQPAPQAPVGGGSFNPTTRPFEMDPAQFGPPQQEPMPYGGPMGQVGPPLMSGYAQRRPPIQKPTWY